MSGAVFDSAIFGGLFPAGEVTRLFTDSAQVRAMLLVEGALARAQGRLGVIPEVSAAFIHRAAMELQVDPAGLGPATAQNGVVVPALVAAFRDGMNAPEHARYVHWGATSQDIMDTALMLRLRQALGLVEADLRAVLKRLADLAATHAGTAMPARTFGQHATPTSFGAVAAAWGEPVLALVRQLPDLRAGCLFVSLSGAAGTAGTLGPAAEETRAQMAAGLGLGDPGRSWHTDRTPVLRIADWFTRVTLALAKPGEDATGLVQTGIGELRLGGGGASSTMPQKQNPVQASALVALARQQTGLHAVLHGAAVQRHQRDGAAWFSEWMCLPQIVLGAAASARLARDMLAGLEPIIGKMAAAVSGGGGLIHAEALSFALAEHLPRPEAQAATKALCREAAETGSHLAELVARDWPQIDTEALFAFGAGLGRAPADARRFADAARALPEPPA